MTGPSQAEIIRWLRMVCGSAMPRAHARFRPHPWYVAQNPVPNEGLAQACNLSKDVIEDAAAGWHNVGNEHVSGITERTVDRIAPVKDAIEAGRLVFYRPEGKRRYEAVWLGPPKDTPRPQPYLIYEEMWDWWAACKCGQRQYMAVDLNGIRFAACYHCLPPSRYRTWGAVVRQHRLVAPLVRAYLSGSWASSEHGSVRTGGAAPPSTPGKQIPLAPNVGVSVSPGSPAASISGQREHVRLTGRFVK